MAETCTKLMVIRHAEKPDKQLRCEGVTEAGAADRDDLIVRGWQRAAALVRLFNPLDPGQARGGLATPVAIFATPATDGSSSKRPLHTVAPLARDLGLGVRTDFALHQENKLVAAALGAGPAVLICWHHEHIPKIMAALGLAVEGWPDDVFDRILVADSSPGGWTLSVVPQRVLPGDAQG